MGASCYLLFITSDPLEQVGGRLGRLLHLPEDVIASTFQALATSGPEIVMAILASTTFIAANTAWGRANGWRERLFRLSKHVFFCDGQSPWDWVCVG